MAMLALLAGGCHGYLVDGGETDDETDIDLFQDRVRHGAPPGSLQLKATEDAKICSRRPYDNYGDAITLRVRSAKRTSYRTYLRFKVSGVAGPVSGATVALFVLNGGPDGGTLHRTSNSWSEDSITWYSAPPPGAPVATAGKVQGGTWVSFDVSSVVTDNGSFSFALSSTSNDSAFYSSREGTHPPVLVIPATPALDARPSPAADATPPAAPDAGTQAPDAGLPPTPDAGAPAPDAGPSPAADAGPPAPDAKGPPIVADYYVSTQGSDFNPGTAAAPCRTIKHALGQAKAGQTVLVKGGTFRELVDIPSSGTSNAWITLRAYPGETVTIDAAGLSLSDWWKGVISVDDVSYVRVQGFRVKGSAGFGIIVNRSTNVEILDNQTYDTRRSGVGVWKSTGVLVDHNDVELAANGGDQECISISESDQVVVTNNHVRNDGAGTAGGEGIDVKDGSSNVVVRGNHVHDLDELGIYVDSWDSHTHDIIVERNLVHDCLGYGIAVAAERGGLVEDVLIRNNITYGNSYMGIVIADWDQGYPHPMQNIKIVNNTCVDNGPQASWGAGISVLNGQAKGVVIRNNICAGNAYGQIVNESSGAVVTASHNLVWGTTSSGHEVNGASAVSVAPGFVNSGGHDYHLSPGSPAINAGTQQDAPPTDFDGLSRPVNGLYDIGALEWR
jgi:hypothetical protein